MARICDLPEEVLENIMLRLPPKSLKQLKLVNKPWYFYVNALIDDPEFVANHLRNMKNSLLSSPNTRFWNLFTISHQDSEDQEVYVDKTHLITVASDDIDAGDCVPCVIEDLKFLACNLDHNFFRLVSHCNGVICIYAYDIDGKGLELISLLNPSLREFKIVFNAPSDFSVCTLGFGYDLRADGYKVVAIKSGTYSNSLEEGPYKAEIYYLSTDSWIEIELGVKIAEFYSYDHQTLYCNGVCYWYFWHFEGIIIAFDVHHEVFQSIELPNSIARILPDKKWNLVEDWSKIEVWNDSLAFFHYVEEDLTFIDMWVLEFSVEGSYSWTNHQSIGPLVNISRPLAFRDHDVLFLQTRYGQLISYNTRTKTIGDDTLENFTTDTFVVYEASLVSVLKNRERAQVQR